MMEGPVHIAYFDLGEGLFNKINIYILTVKIEKLKGPNFTHLNHNVHQKDQACIDGPWEVGNADPTFFRKGVDRKDNTDDNMNQ